MGRLNAKEFAIARAGFESKSSGCSLGSVVGSLLRAVVVFTVTAVRGVVVTMVVEVDNGSRVVAVLAGS